MEDELKRLNNNILSLRWQQANVPAKDKNEVKSLSYGEAESYRSVVTNSQQMIYFAYLTIYNKENILKDVELNNSKWYPSKMTKARFDHQWTPGEIGRICLPDIFNIKHYLRADFYCSYDVWFICVNSEFTSHRVGPEKKDETTILVFFGKDYTFVKTSLEYRKKVIKRGVSNYVKDYTKTLTDSMSDFAIHSMIKRIKFNPVTYSCGFINQKSELVKQKIKDHKLKLEYEQKQLGIYKKLYMGFAMHRPCITNKYTSQNEIFSSLYHKLFQKFATNGMLNFTSGSSVSYGNKYEEIAGKIFRTYTTSSVRGTHILEVSTRPQQLLIANRPCVYGADTDYDHFANFGFEQNKLQIQESEVKKTTKRLRKKKEQSRRKRFTKKNKFKFNKRNYPKMSRKSFRRQYQPSRC